MTIKAYKRLSIGYKSINSIKKWRASVRNSVRIKKYLASGRVPYSEGYGEYKDKIIEEIIYNKDILDLFLNNKYLPENYGFRLDERIVEIPWVLSRIGLEEKTILDAGSVLNSPIIFNHPSIKNSNLVIYNLSPEKIELRSNISYICGDLRNTILNDEQFDIITCISTLEHIGMDNTFLYSNNPRFKEYKPDDYLKVIIELNRLLKHGGKLFITVPYGRYENHGWLQQFDSTMTLKIINEFNGVFSNITFYKYFKGSWQISLEEDCNESSYFDIHNKKEFESDYVAAARAVACIELAK